MTEMSDKSLAAPRYTLLCKSSFCSESCKSLDRGTNRAVKWGEMTTDFNFHQTLFVTPYKNLPLLRVDDVYCYWGEWFPSNGFHDAISPHSSLKDTDPLFICSAKCVWPTQHSSVIFMNGARAIPTLPTLPVVMIRVAIWRLPLTKVFPVLYEQLFDSNQWWTTRMYTLAHWEILQTTSAILPDNVIRQRGFEYLIENSAMKTIHWIY